MMSSAACRGMNQPGSVNQFAHVVPTCDQLLREHGRNAAQEMADAAPHTDLRLERQVLGQILAYSDCWSLSSARGCANPILPVRAQTRVSGDQ